MTGGLNLARAVCAAESSAGSGSSFAPSSLQAVSRESSAPSLADSTAAISVLASGGKMAMRSYFARFTNSRASNDHTAKRWQK
jgi:hypothetical protein